MSATAEQQAPPAQAPPASGGVEKVRKQKRTYMLHNPETYACLGKYVSTTPRLAALKAASRGHTDILLRETNTKIMHHYEGGIRSLDTPQVVQRGDQTVTYTNKPFVKTKARPFLMPALALSAEETAAEAAAAEAEAK